MEKAQMESKISFFYRSIQQRLNNCMLNLCVLGRIIYQGFCFVWVFNGPVPAVHLGTDQSTEGLQQSFWKLPSPCRDGVINRPLSQFCFIEGDNVQVISLKTFVLEGNYRIVLCLEHSLVNSGVKRQVSVAQGPTQTRRVMTLIPLKKDFSQPSPSFIFFF